MASSENSSFLPTRNAERRGRLAVDQPGSSFAVLIRAGIHQRHAIGAYRQDFGLPWWLSACLPSGTEECANNNGCRPFFSLIAFIRTQSTRPCVLSRVTHISYLFSYKHTPCPTSPEDNKQSMRLQRDCGKAKVSRSHSTLSVKAVSRRSSRHTHLTSLISAARSSSKNLSVDNTAMS